MGKVKGILEENMRLYPELYNGHANEEFWIQCCKEELLERLIRHLEEVDLWNCRVCNATGKLVEDLSPVGENRPEPFYYFCPSCKGKGVVIIPKSNTIAYLKAILREDDKFLDNQDFSIIIEKYKQKKGK